MKKRKGKKLRDKFTDALGEEISARENLDIEKKERERLEKNATPKVNLTKETPPAPPPQPKPKIETPQLETPESQIEIVQVNVDEQLEQKIFAEADNQFLEKKIPRPRRRLNDEGDYAPSRSAFRARAMQERIEEEKFAKNKKSTVKDADLRRNLTRAEVTGAAIAAVMLVYATTTADKPLFFVSLSLLTHTARPLIGAFFGKYNRPVQNALRGFSIAIFFGALLFLVI